MQLPTPQETASLLAAQPAELALGPRIRRMVAELTAGFSEEEVAELLARWRVIASSPTLRNRAAEFERTTATMVLESLTAATGRPVGPTDTVVAGAYLSAFTVGLLAWADSHGERKLLECIEEAFDALGSS